MHNDCNILICNVAGDSFTVGNYEIFVHRMKPCFETTRNILKRFEISDWLVYDQGFPSNSYICKMFNYPAHQLKHIERIVPQQNIFQQNAEGNVLYVCSLFIVMPQ